MYIVDNNFIEYGGWNFTYRTEFMENHNMGLIIEVKYPLNNLTTQGKNSNDCVVCTENTNDELFVSESTCSTNV